MFDPAAYEPAARRACSRSASACPALGLKLGPGIPHTALPADAQAQWVSVDGDVVEVGLWFGPLAPEGPGRTALVLRDGEAHVVRADAGRSGRPTSAPSGGYLYEPDGAVIRAGLVGEIAAQVHGRLLDPTIAYVTSDALARRPRRPRPTGCSTPCRSA